MQSTKKRSYFAIVVVASVVFAGAVGASIMLPFAKVAFAKSENFYVIYYGHLIDENGKATDQATRILTARPELVIVPHSFPDGEPNLTPEVLQQFKDAGIKVLTYTWTNYGARDLNAVKADIDSQMASGVDGIFVDEVTNIETNAENSYYLTIYNKAKSYGQDMLVVMNPGHYKVTERIMPISDIVSLEEEWVYHDQISWMHKYPSSRFMGVSSNEYCTGCINESNAASKTAEAWQAGIGYHFATDLYIDLPTWFDSYVSQVEEKKTTQS
ncbi:MAG TPA: spherulation-specific family 4 protein [Nitrososphaera sp.]|nr:spherulation-specific family 4 protein [Nitrososphaera sp.]